MRFVIHQSLATVVVLIVPLTIRLMKTCSTRSKRLDQCLSDYRASKDKQSVLNNCSVTRLFNFWDWRGRTNSRGCLFKGALIRAFRVLKELN